MVTPIAPLAEEPDEQTAAQLEKMRVALPDWAPGHVADPVQRVRNYLFVAAVPDVFQMRDLERFVPMVVYERIQEVIPKEDLIKILYWIATHRSMETTRRSMNCDRSACSTGPPTWNKRAAG